MHRLLIVNHVLIATFGIASGAYKLARGEADVRIFAALGMNATLVAIFGGVQLLAAAATIPGRSRVVGAMVLAVCNLLATIGLFAAKQQPFGYISTVFVLMALAVALTASGART